MNQVGQVKENWMLMATCFAALRDDTSISDNSLDFNLEKSISYVELSNTFEKLHEDTEKLFLKNVKVKKKSSFGKKN